MYKRLEKVYLVSFLILSTLLLDSCHSSKKVTKTSAETTTSQEVYVPIPENHPVVTHPKKAKPDTPMAVTTNKETREKAIVSTYAEKLGVSKSDITNYDLYNFIDLWYGTPYKYAGRSMSGVDCSDFVSLLFQSVYNITITGAVPDVYRQCRHIKPSQLKEGDLVFFKINKRSLSHVGVYLQNHKFVHASVHAGVIIDDLGEDYYKKYFRLAGRIPK